MQFGENRVTAEKVEKLNEFKTIYIKRTPQYSAEFEIDARLFHSISSR